MTRVLANVWLPLLLAAMWIAVLAHVTGAHVAAQTSGRTVWDGVYTSEQAERGRPLYAQHCASCHGGSLQGAEHRALTGERFWASWQELTVDRLLRHVTANMPHSEDGLLKGTLGASVYAAIVAHMLDANGFPAGSTELSVESGEGVRIVRKDGSSELPAGSFVHVVGCLARGADRSTWHLQRSSRPVRVIEGEAVSTATPLGDREFTLRFVLTPLDKVVGHRVSVRGSLMGQGGSDGLNVTSVQSIAAACD